MANTLTTYVVCFDISDDRVRRRVVKQLLKYGDRVQYSVFELAFKQTRQLNNLQQQMRNVLEPGDEIRFYRLCGRCQTKSCAIPESAIATWPGAVLIS